MSAPGRMERARPEEDDVLSMPEIGVTLPLAELYEGLTFEDHPVEDNDNEQTPPAA